MIHGVDVHNGYGRISWDEASQYVEFCYAKCTEGNRNTHDGKPYVDEQFAANVAGCRANNVAVGAYHYCYCLPDHPDHPGRSPEEEMDRFYEASEGLGSQDGELPPMLDIEHPEPQDAARWGCTRPQISAWLKRAAERVVERWGRKPILYTYPAWWRWIAAGADVSWASEYEPCFADYGWPGEGTPPDGWTPPHWSWVSKTWSDWAICQYSANGSNVTIPGIHACPIDRDCIRDRETLERLTTVGT